jgi:hypothetical protein
MLRFAPGMSIRDRQARIQDEDSRNRLRHISTPFSLMAKLKFDAIIARIELLKMLSLLQL